MDGEVTRNVKVPDHVGVSVIQSVINMGTFPQTMFVDDGGIFWSLENMSRYLYQYNDKGKLLRTIKCWLPIRSAAMASSKEMIIIDDKAKCVKTVDLTQDDKISILTRPNPHQEPTALCFNNAKELVVAITSDEGTSHRLAIYTNTASKILNTIEFYREDGEKVPIFKAPITKVVQNGNGDYIVLCGKEVMAVDDKGTIRWTYRAEQKGQRANQFLVMDIVCDKHNHVLISDTNNCEIDMLDPDGKFLMCVMTNSKLHGKPLALALDAKNALWLSQDDKSVFILTYLR